jgi:hypothetical protein
MKVGEPIWRDIEPPRCLTEDERRLLVQLTAATDEALLQRQVDTAVVGAICRCGCSSVRLHSDEPRIPDARVLQLSASDRSDYFYVTAIGGGAQVTVHVFQGRVGELEVFAGDGVAVSLSDVTYLADVTVA